VGSGSICGSYHIVREHGGVLAETTRCTTTSSDAAWTSCRWCARLREDSPVLPGRCSSCKLTHYPTVTFSQVRSLPVRTYPLSPPRACGGRVPAASAPVAGRAAPLIFAPCSPRWRPSPACCSLDTRLGRCVSPRSSSSAPSSRARASSPDGCCASTRATSSSPSRDRDGDADVLARHRALVRRAARAGARRRARPRAEGRSARRGRPCRGRPGRRISGPRR